LIKHSSKEKKFVFKHVLEYVILVFEYLVKTKTATKLSKKIKVKKGKKKLSEKSLRTKKMVASRRERERGIVEKKRKKIFK